MITAKVHVDTHDTSVAIVPPVTLQPVMQTNGVIRIHAANGGYLFSIIRDATTGQVYTYVDGFGTKRQNITEVNLKVNT